MDRNTIEINYQTALAKADELEAIGNELMQALEQEYGNSLEILAGNWKGVNADMYLGKGYRLAEQMRGTAREVVDAANQIRRTAETIYYAEMAALNIIEARIY